MLYSKEELAAKFAFDPRWVAVCMCRTVEFDEPIVVYYDEYREELSFYIIPQLMIPGEQQLYWAGNNYSGEPFFSKKLNEPSRDWLTVLGAIAKAVNDGVPMEEAEEVALRVLDHFRVPLGGSTEFRMQVDMYLYAVKPDKER